MKHKEEGQ